MRTVAITNDPVRIGFIVVLLRGEGIESVVLDGYASAVDGSVGAIPRRIAVHVRDEARALRLLREAGEAT